MIARRVCVPVMYAVLIRFDPAGECPVIVREGDRLPEEPGVRFRFVAQVESDVEACAIVLRLQPERLERDSARG